jgi:hypothetical protein
MGKSVPTYVVSINIAIIGTIYDVTMGVTVVHSLEMEHDTSKTFDGVPPSPSGPKINLN